MTTGAGTAGRGGRAKILVIDDEPHIADFLRLGLEREGYEVVAAADGRSGLTLIREGSPDLVILDIMLPALDGLAVLRQLRGEGRDVPVLLLSARDELDDKVAGLDVGADDYLTKPFRLEELLARSRALLRRSAAAPSRTIAYADVTLDADTRDVARAGRAIELTPREFDLLRCFLEHPRRVLDRALLLERVWGYESGDPNIVEVYVGYLRRKLGAPELIRTVRGVGYVMKADDAEAGAR